MVTDLDVGTNDTEALEPLRSRYSQQHYALRKFYYECSNLKYLTGLINVPKLGQVRSYISPLLVAILTPLAGATKLVG